MKCIFCKHGNTHPGQVTVTLNRHESTFIFKNVPADVCENCGEFFLDEDVTNELLRRVQKAIDNGAEVDILRYAA